MCDFEKLLNLGSVDPNALHDEADFQREVDRLLPGATEQVAEAMAEVAWEVVKDFHSGSRHAFVQDRKSSWVREMGAETKQGLREAILKKLRALKSE